MLFGGPQAAPQQPARPPDQWCVKNGQRAVTGMLASCTNNWHRNLNQKFSFCGRVDLAMSSKSNWNYIHAFKFTFKIILHEIEVTKYRRMSVPPSCSNESRSMPCTLQSPPVYSSTQYRLHILSICVQFMTHVALHHKSVLFFTQPLFSLFSCVR